MGAGRFSSLPQRHGAETEGAEDGEWRSAERSAAGAEAAPGSMKGGIELMGLADGRDGVKRMGCLKLCYQLHL